MNTPRFSINHLHLVAVVLSIAIAAWMNYIQHGWINSDSVIYFEVARLFSLGEWQAGIKVWGWPFFSLMLAGVHHFIGLDFHHSAQLLNTILFAIATASFLQLIREAGGTYRTLITGSLVLFSSQYIIGDILPMLLRDQGFWAFFLTSLVFFIRYAKHYQLKDALLWQIGIILATLFRIEGIVYLTLLPLILYWISSPGNKIKSVLTAHSLNIALGISGLVALGIMEFKISELGRLQEIFNLHLYDELTKQLFDKAEIMSEAVLGKHLDEFAITGLLLTFLYVILFKILSSLGITNLVTCTVAALPCSPSIHKRAKQVLNTAILISVLNMVLIIIKVFVLSGRYALPLTFLMLVYSSFGLDYIMQWFEKNKPRHPLARSLLLLVLAGMITGLVGNIFPKSSEYNHEQHAASWLVQHHVNIDQVFFDSARLRYYAHAPYTGSGGDFVIAAIQQNKYIDAEYIVMGFNVKETEVQLLFEQRYHQYQEIARFYGPKKKKGTLIYRLDKAEKRKAVIN